MGGPDSTDFFGSESENDSDGGGNYEWDNVECPVEVAALYDEATDKDEPTNKEEEKEEEEEEEEGLSLSRDLRYFVRWQCVCVLWALGCGFFGNPSEWVAVVLVDAAVVTVYWAYRQKSLIKERARRAEDAAVLELKGLLSVLPNPQKCATSTQDHVAESVSSSSSRVEGHDEKEKKTKKKESEKEKTKDVEFIDRVRLVFCAWCFVSYAGMGYAEYGGNPLLLASVWFMYFVFFVNGYRNPTILYAGLFEVFISMMIAEHKICTVTRDLSITLIVVLSHRIMRRARDCSRAFARGLAGGKLWSLVRTSAKLEMACVFGIGKGDKEALLFADRLRKLSLLLGTGASEFEKLSEKRDFFEKLKKDLQPSGMLIKMLSTRAAADNRSAYVLLDAWSLEEHLLYSKKSDAYYEFAKGVHAWEIEQRGKKE